MRSEQNYFTGVFFASLPGLFFSRFCIKLHILFGNAFIVSRERNMTSRSTSQKTGRGRHNYYVMAIYSFQSELSRVYCHQIFPIPQFPPLFLGGGRLFLLVDVVHP